MQINLIHTQPIEVRMIVLSSPLLPLLSRDTRMASAYYWSSFISPPACSLSRLLLAISRHRLLASLSLHAAKASLLPQISLPSGRFVLSPWAVPAGRPLPAMFCFVLRALKGLPPAPPCALRRACALPKKAFVTRQPLPVFFAFHFRPAVRVLFWWFTGALLRFLVFALHWYGYFYIYEAF